MDSTPRPSPDEPVLAWDEPDPFDLRHIGQDQDWSDLLAEYEGQPGQSSPLGSGSGAYPTPLARCLAIAQAHEASTVVIETRYMDRDYRSEFSAFYARVFESLPGTAHRLHFFRSHIARDDIWRLPAAEDGFVEPAVGYVGYIVVRPLEVARVGRTMLLPPPEVARGVRTSVSEKVTFFGQPLRIRAVPFMQQDGQLAVCAHAAIWMAHYIAYRHGRIPRRSIGDLSLLADPALALGRPLPSGGLSDIQISSLFQQLEIPAACYEVQKLPQADVARYGRSDPPPLDPADLDEVGLRVGAVACRYLNSAIPVLVQTARHALLLCGYTRDDPTNKRKSVTLTYHDDQAGPYLSIPAEDLGRRTLGNDSEGAPKQGAWEYMFAPLPEKLWLGAEEAEMVGARLLMARAKEFVGVGWNAAKEVLDLRRKEQLAFRAYAIESNHYRWRAAQRGLDGQVVRDYRLARWPRFVWVVEAVDRNRRQRADSDDARRAKCVLGEVVLDSTRSSADPAFLAMRLPGVYAVRSTGAVTTVRRCGTEAYATGGVGPA